MDRPEMGACEHEGVRWTKQGPRGIIEIWCCPLAHASIHRRMLTLRGFTPNAPAARS
jgi:hypothetical protein